MTADDIDVLSLTALADAERASLLVGKPPRVRRSVWHASTRWLMHPVAAAFAVSRMVAVAALLAGGSSTQGRPSTGGLTAWDGQWY